MGIKVPRKKERVFLLSFLYTMQRFLPLGTKARLRFFLDLEWIFDRLAMEASFRYYPTHEHPFRTQAHRTILRHIGPTDTVLDLGCNAGQLSGVIAGRAREVVGVDHDGEAIARAIRGHALPNLTFHHTDALEFLQRSGKKFDVLILSHVLEHLDQPAEFIDRFKGFFDRIYIELPDFDRTYLNQYRIDAGSKLVYTDDDHVTEFDRDELRDLLEGCGLRIVEAEYRFGVQRLWCEVQR